MSATPPSNADDLFRIARQHHCAGRLADAETAYRGALEIDARHAGALGGLGTLALQADENELAEQLLEAAIALSGESAEVQYHLGLAQQAQSRYAKAIASFRRAAMLAPMFYESRYQLAVCLQLSGELDRALTEYAQAFSIKADDAVALANYGIALIGARKWDEAISALTRAAGLNPKIHEAWLQLGLALRAAGRLDDAIDALQRAALLQPDDFKAMQALAGALAGAGKFDEALPTQRRALALAPDDADAQCALGELLLRRGAFAEGFEHIEHRWRRRTPPWPTRKLSIPRWDGGYLHGRTIYLHAEQCISDAIQFVRFIPLVAQKGGAVVVECQPTLQWLFAASFPHVRWISPGETLPRCDTYCPMMSVPRVLAIDPPWASVDRAYLQSPASSVNLDHAMLNVGLVWAGSPSNLADRERSLAIEQLAPLGAVNHARFFSLQRGFGAAQARQAPFAMDDLTMNLDDFMDTAAAIASLDLVITVDTAVAHLAGAMGKPVWTLLPLVAHWRWMQTGDSTPWYPSMRLFRQQSRGNWNGTIIEIAAALRALVAQRGGA